MGVRWTCNLSELDVSHVSIAGGKGASLGELMRAGAPVPSGFVVTSDAFEAFMTSGDHASRVAEVIQLLDTGQIEVTQAAEQITAQLEEARLPDGLTEAISVAMARLGVQCVSVRSSATCEDGGDRAWAGQLETFLNVSPECVVENVRACWLSLFRASALAYGVAHGYGKEQVSVAVVVQTMIDSEVSGIAFSVHPVTQEPNIHLIEACLGLGEAIVSGAIVPDQYVVDRDSDAIIDRTVGGQRKGLFLDPQSPEPVWRELGESGDAQKLTDSQVIEYAAMLDRIERHFGYPVDTEWALSDGQFQVLQARPITTLADEYRDPVLDASLAWNPLVRRPLSLMEVSIWAHWIDAKHAQESLGMHIDRALSIQDDVDIAHEFFSQDGMEAAHAHLVDLFQKDRAHLIGLLRHGHDIYQDSQARIEQGDSAFSDLDEAVDFFANVAQHTTALPAMLLNVYEREGWEDPEVRSLAEALRSHSLYPLMERRIIDPLVARVTQAVGFSAPELASTVTTWSELRRGELDRDLLESRLEAVRSGHRFVFQSIDGQDHVRFVSQTGYLLMRLAGQRTIVPKTSSTELSGQAAWPGVYRGRARVVLSPDAIGQHIEEGEVLVSIQSSPALMPLLQRCGAIVTDDGGIACHAAIIARELRKPTLIGTNSATSFIHTGDLVEVDAYEQVVRLLERADS